MTTCDKPLILVIDDRQDIFRFCERCLGDAYAFRHVPDGRAAQEFLRCQPPAAVLLDRDFSHADPAGLLGAPSGVRDEGLVVLRWLREQHPRLPVLMVTGVRDLDMAIAVADLDAQFLAWEDVAEQPGLLATRLEQALDTGRQDCDEMLRPYRQLGLVVVSPAFAGTLHALSRALPGRAPLLLLGETGTGKDALAYAAHALYGDPGRPFVAVNVAALNPNLIESELFGHARGAFTSAVQAGLGKLRAANGGTLFLNEIGDLPLEVQAKLLSALEHREVVPVGDVRSFPADFRLVAATSRDLRQLVEAGLFRRDLLHRIAWHTIEVPALRDRREDIPALAHSFLYATPAGRTGKVLGFSREALEYLESLRWPGNVRELQGAIEAACAVARHTVMVTDLYDVIRKLERLVPVTAAAQAPALPVPPAPSTASSPTDDDGPVRRAAEDAAFGGRSYLEVTRAYFKWLERTCQCRYPEMARRARVAKDTIYKWRKRFSEANDTGPAPGDTRGPAAGPGPGDTSRPAAGRAEG